MSFRLVPLIPGPFPAIALQRPVLLIGRHGECDVRIDHARVSRRHCCLAMAYDRVLVRDLGSRNKVRVNGQVVEEAQLLPGDELAIGPLLYRFDSEDGPRGPAPAPAKAASPPPAPSSPSPAPEANGPEPPAPSAAPKPASNGDPSWMLDDSDIDLIPLDDL